MKVEVVDTTVVSSLGLASVSKELVHGSRLFSSYRYMILDAHITDTIIFITVA